MAFDFLRHASFMGPTFPEPYIQFDLENDLRRLGLLPRATGEEGRQLQEGWEVYRRILRQLVTRGGAERVRNHILEPLVKRLGYHQLTPAADVPTREGVEAGGHLMKNSNGAQLRVWAVGFEEDLDAPSRRGRAYRFSPTRIAQRVLLTVGERVGLLTNGVELRLLLSDPARPDSQIIIPIQAHWRSTRDVPETFILLLALACPAGLKAVPELSEKARLQQTRVTKELRQQARKAIEGFVQAVLDHPDNQVDLAQETDKTALARYLWREGLILIYRLLVILKLEAFDDPAQAFSFASVGLWRNTYSPSTALAQRVRLLLDRGAETGHMLEDGLRVLFRIFTEGFQCTELHVRPLGGALFGDSAAPLLARLKWGERACALLMDQLLWTTATRQSATRRRIHYGSLDIEDLGRVYEALLELEPGVTSETMCRLRRQKLEVVIPVAQGEKYRPAISSEPIPIESETDVEVDLRGETDADNSQPEDEENDSEDSAPSRGRKTKVEWIEEILPGRFYLRVGLGRKATGSYYTPHSFVRFLVQETLGPQVVERSPQEDPNPGAILRLKVLDPAMGSGHFLVEACRFLGEKLYEACRLCDEKALAAEAIADQATSDAAKHKALVEAAEFRRRVQDLPDPEDELVKYLPSRAPEGEESGLSQKKAEALCRRLIAVHCLYGVDKNPLAVELAKISVWLVSHAEGMPLTFLDHRLVLGDSLTGPFFNDLLTYPGSRVPVNDLFHQGLQKRIFQALHKALGSVQDLEASVGISLAELEAKCMAKKRLDESLQPFRLVAAAWVGGVMMGAGASTGRKGKNLEAGRPGLHMTPGVCDDEAYAALIGAVVEEEDLSELFLKHPALTQMVNYGESCKSAGTSSFLQQGGSDASHCSSRLEKIEEPSGTFPVNPAVSYDLIFPEVFYPHCNPSSRVGFDAVLGNPPWDAILFKTKEFFASFDFGIMNAPTKRERDVIEHRLISEESVGLLFWAYKKRFEEQKELNDRLYHHQKVFIEGDLAGRQLDQFRVFMERNSQLLSSTGITGVVVPSAFHSNEGASGIRRLYLEEMGLSSCYSFENRRKLFEIHSSFKYALVTASRKGPTSEFKCAFYLHDDEWLFSTQENKVLRYSLEFIRRTGGEYLSFLEISSPSSFEIARTIFSNGVPLGQLFGEYGILLCRECDMTNDAHRFTPSNEFLPNGVDPRDPDVVRSLLARGYLNLHEGKTFHQYDDHWEDRPRYVVALNTLNDKLDWIKASQYFRMAFRAVASSTNERTSIFCFLPPASIFGNSAPCERDPSGRPNSTILTLLACLNSFSFDWILRQKTSANVNLFIINGCSVPPLSLTTSRFLAHAALRLTCNHSGYAPLWQEQLGELWRETNTEPQVWPVVVGDEARWEVRAAADALVAELYGLAQEQYEYILSSFSHSSYSRAPQLCLTKYDEVKGIGIDAFCKKYDPYWDIPLKEGLPLAIIEYPEFSIPQEKKKQKSFEFQPISDISKRDETSFQSLVALLRERGVVTSSDAQSLLNLNAATVRPVLRRLVAEGVAIVEGQKRGTRYILKQKS